MSPAKRPSAVTGLRRAVAAPQPAAVPDPFEEHSFGRNQAPPAPPAGKTTRITVDLSAARYEPVREYAARHRVTIADVVRELLRAMEADPALAAAVLAGIEARKARKAELLRAAEE